MGCFGTKKPQNLCTLAADSPKPKTDDILGYVAQNAISTALPTFGGFHPSKLP